TSPCGKSVSQNRHELWASDRRRLMTLFGLASHCGGFSSRVAIERLTHTRLDTLPCQRLLVFFAQERVLQPIRDSGAAFGHINGALVGVFLARHACPVLAVIVRAVPADEAKRLLADAEVGMEPVAPIGGGGDKPHRLVILAKYLIRLAVLPRRHPDRPRPGIGVALAPQTDEHRGRQVRVAIRIPAGFVLPDKTVEYIVRHIRLDAQIAGGTAVIEIELAIDDVRDEVALAHGKAAQRIRCDVVLRLEEVGATIEARGEFDGAIEDPIDIAEEV